MDQLTQIQRERLQSTVNRVYKRVPFYKEAMIEAGIRPEDIHGLEDLERLPFTDRKAFSQNYPYGLFACPLRDIVRIHTIRGIDGTPVVIGQTRQDLEHRVEISRRFLEAAGVGSDDIVQICLDPGMSVVAYDLKEGAEAIGALVIPPDPISTKARVRILADFKTTTLVTTPSYGQYLLGIIEQEGPSIASLSLKRVIVVGEVMDVKQRAQWLEDFGVETRAGYGITEAMGPGMAFECEAMDGLHMSLDHYIAEVIDPETGQQVPDGVEGELVITTITTRANPLIRFRTGDVTRLIKAPCPCGRTFPRMAPVTRRIDGILSVRGVKISDEILESFLRDELGYSPGYCLLVKKVGSLERIELKVAMEKAMFSGSLPQLHRKLRDLEEAFQEIVGLSATISPVEKRTVQELVQRAEGRILIQ